MREPHPCSTLPTRNLFPQRMASVVCLQSTALGQGLGRSTFNVAYSVVGGRDAPCVQHGVSMARDAVVLLDRLNTYRADQLVVGEVLRLHPRDGLRGHVLKRSLLGF